MPTAADAIISARDTLTRVKRGDMPSPAQLQHAIDLLAKAYDVHCVKDGFIWGLLNDGIRLPGEHARRLETARRRESEV